RDAFEFERHRDVPGAFDTGRRRLGEALDDLRETFLVLGVSRLRSHFAHPSDMELDTVLDRLYAVALDEFTATRNSLAKELAGDDARQVKALKKPNIAAWALNQLARSDDLADLFDVTD